MSDQPNGIAAAKKFWDGCRNRAKDTDTETVGRRPSQMLRALGSTLAAGICRTKPMVPDEQRMFPKKSIFATRNRLAILFRMFMNSERITKADYDSRVDAFGRASGKTPAEMATPRSNAVKAITGDNLSVMQLERNLEFMGWEIVDLSMIIRDTKTGEIRTLALSDAPKYAEGMGTLPSEDDPILDLDLSDLNLDD